MSLVDYPGEDTKVFEGDIFTYSGKTGNGRCDDCYKNCDYCLRSEII